MPGPGSLRAVHPHRRRRHRAIGGPATLVTLQASTPAISNASRYARIIEEHALLRRLIGVAGEIAEMSSDLPEDVTKTVDQAESLVFEVAQRRVTDTMDRRRVHLVLTRTAEQRLEKLTLAHRAELPRLATLWEPLFAALVLPEPGRPAAARKRRKADS